MSKPAPDTLAAKLQAQFEEAIALHQQGQLARAQAIYKNVLKARPRHFDALHLLGVIATQTNQHRLAVDLIGQAIAINPNNAVFYCNRGYALQQLKQLDAAVASYDKAIKINPGTAEAYSNRGNALQELRRLDAAVASYDKAIAIKPDYAEAHGNRGNALQELKKLDAALASYDRAIAIKPDYAEAWYNRGNALQELKQADAALASYDKAISISPGYAEAHNNRGNALSELKHLEAALASYDKAISIRPDYAEAHNNRGNALKELGQLKAAVVSYDKAISIRPDYAEAHNNHGNALKELDQLDAALASYDKAIAIRPDYAEAHNGRGVALLELKQPAAAIASYDIAIAINLDFAEAYSNRGYALRGLQQLDAAVASYDKAIAIKPEFSEAYYNRGNALHDLKRPDAAIASYDQAIAIRPDHAESYNNRGNTLYELKQLDAAVASYDKAIALKPDSAEAYNNRGNVLLELKQLEAAVASYDQAIAVKPDYAEAYYNRGNALQELNQPGAAVASYDRAIAIKPDYAFAYSNRGAVLQELMQLDAAIASYDKAIAIKPDYAEAYANRGVALQQLKQMDAAVASYEKAIAIKPDYAEAHSNKAMALLLGGNLEQGFELYEWRWEPENLRKAKRNFIEPLWLGHEALLNKTILLHSEQGFGDTIQFCRYAKLVADAGASVILEAPTRLVGLLRGLAGVSNVVGRGSTLPAFDYHCPLLSLPLAFKTTLDTIPNPVGYLQSRGDRLEFWSKKLGEKTTARIGLVWSGSTTYKFDRNRSFDLASLLPHLPGEYDYICLQKDLHEIDRAPLRSSAIRFFGDEQEDFTDAAALCDLMDVVISVDTSVAHVSGALGKTTWVLLAYAPHWPWMLDRDDSPWYSSVKLYRQNSEMNWNSVFERVRNDLLQLNSSSRAPDCGSGRLSGLLGPGPGSVPNIPEPKPASDVLAATFPPQTLKSQLDQAIALHQQGHLARAQAAYENILKAQPEHFDALHLLGVIAIQTNQHRLAVDLIGQAIAINPNDAAFYSNRGVALQELKLLDDAVASYDKAIAIRPGDADVYSNRGNVLQELRQLEAAVASYDKAIAVKPDYAEAHNNRGNALQGLRQLEAAVASYDRAIAAKPDYAEAHYNRGTVLQELKQLEAAVASYDKAIVIRPDDADVHTNRGNALQELKQLEAAVASYDKALAIKRDYAEAYSNRGNALQKLKQLDAAVASYDKAVAIKPDFAEAYSNRGVAMQDLKQLEAAIASFDKAVALKPDYAEAYSNRGVALQQHNQIDAALASYDKAVAINPDYAQAYLNKGMALLLKGNIEQGFELYEWRWKTEESKKDHRNFMQPLWLGQEALQDKTILLYSEQGLGDTIQFCRYARLVADRGANVVLEVPKPLLGLLQGLAGVSEVVEMGLPLPAFDFHCPLLSLPLAYKTTLDTIPNPVAYLQSRRDKFEFWAKKLGEKTTTRVGLVWSGSTSNKHYHDRSLDLELLLPHLHGKYDYICLQKELREVDRVPLRSSSIRFFGDELNDFTDTAALCDLMDVVISIDTSVAHLSGALGKATWVLLPYVADWRWLLDRDDSPWYPSVRLYRQNSENNWNSVFESVKGDLLKVNSDGLVGDEMPISPSDGIQNLPEPKPALDTLTARFQGQLEEGMTLHLQGQLARAQAVYENILKAEPKHFDALHLLGVIAIQEKQHQLAVDLIDQAIAINPNDAAFYSNRGVALQELKLLDAAVASYQKAIAVRPDDADVHSNRGNALQELKQLEAAVASYDQAIAIKPDYAEAYNNRGNALQALKQMEAAVASYDQAIAVKPDYAEAHYNRGTALHELKRLEEAVAGYDKAIALRPDYAQAHNNRGNALRVLKRLDAAVASYDKAIALKPDFAEAYNNRGTALQELKQLEAAVASYDEAVALKLDYAEAYSNRGLALHELTQLDAATASFDKAIALKPDYAEAFWNKALTSLLGGDLAQGFELYEWRWRTKESRTNQRKFMQPLWLGQDTLQNKTILLHSEQGFGDTIQFCRYAKLVADKGANIILEVRKPLMDLLQGLAGVSSFVEQGRALPAFDYHCPLLSLPLAFKTTLDSIPNPGAYLRARRDKIEFWRRRLGERTKARIGLVWNGNNAQKNDRNRSMHLASLLPHLPGEYEYVCLQTELREIDRASLRSSSIRFFGDEINDFTDTAALCDLMDVVISVDTAVAHLSGALGKTTWVLLAYAPDWRWLLDRGESPWYSSVRLYRQNGEMNWNSVLARVRNDLMQLHSNGNVCGSGRLSGLLVSQTTNVPGTPIPKPASDALTATLQSQKLQSRFDEAKAFQQQGQLARAQVICENILKALPRHCEALHLLGVIAVQRNQHRLAVDLIGQAIEISPNDAAFYSNRGVALQGLKELNAAVANYDKAIALKPGVAESHYSRGVALLELGQLAAAIASYDNAISLKPDYAEAYNNRGYALQQLKQQSAAVESYDKAIAFRSDYAEAYNNRSIALQELKQLDAAVASCEKAIALRPDYADAYYNRGNALHELSRLEAAVASYDRAIAIKPDYAEAHNNRGNALKELKQLHAAVASHDKAVALKPDYAEAYSNRGNALHDLAQFDAAVASYDKAIVLKPDFAEAYSNRGTAFHELTQLNVAIANFDKAIALKPDYVEAYWNKALAMLLNGDIEQGFELYEWRWKTEDSRKYQRNFIQPLWLGREALLNKTVLLHSEQGLGDTIQFCRYAKLVADAGANVVLEVRKPLVGLLQGLTGVRAIVEQGKTLPAFDYHCPLLSLPLAFRTTIDTIPDPDANLQPRRDRLEFWESKLGKRSKRRIGLVWSGSTTYKYDHSRSIDLASLLPHLPRGYDYVCLQKELRDVDRAPLRSSAIRFFGDEQEDFTDAAALCDLMDLVISVDTSVAHLSGTLRKATWVLLAYTPHWPWMLDRDDSPWYSSVKLYRQNSEMNWNSVFERVRNDLLQLNL